MTALSNVDVREKFQNAICGHSFMVTMLVNKKMSGASDIGRRINTPKPSI